MNASAMLCEMEGVLGDIATDDKNKWPKTYVNLVGELPN